MEIKFIGYYVIKYNTNYKCGYEIIRGPFQNKMLAEKGLAQFQKMGEWPGPKPTTEQDV